MQAFLNLADEVHTAAAKEKLKLNYSQQMIKTEPKDCQKLALVFQETILEKDIFDLFYTASARGIHLKRSSSSTWKLVLTWRDYGKWFKEPI